MSNDRSSCCSSECPPSCKLLLAGLLLGGALLVLTGIWSWRASPPRKADRLLGRARSKINEIEGILADWQAP